MKTKYGNAKINFRGYYQIISYKEGNYGKYLHRLIARDYFGEWIDDPNDYFQIHHIDGDRTNNCVLNLEPMKPEEHSHLHMSDENHYLYGNHHSEENKLKRSKTQNTSGYYRVIKRNCKKCTQGFIWVYRYHDENGKRIQIVSVDIKKLEEKVKSKGLEWIKISDKKDRRMIKNDL